MSPSPDAEPASGTGATESAEDLYEDAPCGYLSTDPDGTIVRANRTFYRWTGYRPEDLVGRMRFQEILSAGGRIFYDTHYAPLLRMQGFVREIAIDLRCANGEALPTLMNSTLVSDERGEPASIRTIILDATERRGYERELLHARRRAEESEARARMLARRLQATLVPPAPPTIAKLDVAAAYRPAGDGDEVGGDFYDVFESAPGDWALLIGDVCGKGVEAAAVATLARNVVRATAIRTRRPSAVLAVLNLVCANEHPDRHVTALYARVRAGGPGTMRLTLAVGGHPLPLLVTAGGETGSLGRPGSLLGVFAEPELHDASRDLSPGDVVVLYTDGVTEVPGEDAADTEARLRALVAERRTASAAEITAAIVDAAVGAQGGRTRDDIAVVTLKHPSA